MKSFVLICLTYLACNFIFNFVIWQQIIIPERNDVLTIQGESFIYEYFAEVVRVNILTGKSPFTPATNIFYPFGWDFTLDDVAPINGFYFLLLRPFLSLHQSLMSVLVLNIFTSNISMYGLLRLLKISKKTAFLTGLVFGFSPFMSVRVGAHPSYTTFYLFPLILIFCLLITRSLKRSVKIKAAFCLGVTLVMTLFTNLYYAVMVFLLTVGFLGYFVIARKKQLSFFLKKDAPYLVISAVTMMILLLPWLKKAYEFLSFSPYIKPSGWFDTIFHSADLVGIFIPNRLNPLYQPLLKMLGQRWPNLINTFENFIYPGVIILAAYFFIIFIRKKLPIALKKKIVPYFYISLVFWVLTLGPFLHVLGKKTAIPLPYVLINITPFLQMARAPGRFIVPFVFLASIVTAYVIDYFLEKKYPRRKNLIFIILIALFFLDQSYTITLPPTIRVSLPTKIYHYLKSQNHKSPILEIPFSIRDGLKNLGDFYSPWLPWAQLIHRHPSFGVYGGRIDDDLFLYYKNNPLFSPLAKLIDRKTVDYQEIADQIEAEKMKTTLEFFGIEYAVVKNNAVYSPTVGPIMKKLAFRPIKKDGDYILWRRKLQPQLIPQFKLGDQNDELFLASGWGKKELTGRWTIGKIARLLLSINQLQPPQLLKFQAKTLADNQSLTIYVNKQSVQKLSLSQKPRDYSLDLQPYLKEGLNLITFKFAKTYQPSRLLRNNPDNRHLAAFFSEMNFVPSLPGKQN